MRVLVLSLFVGVVLAVPQGYNYQLNVIPYGNGALIYPQVQAIQQFASQQEQSVIQQQLVSMAAAEVPAPTQYIPPNGGNSGSQFANQLIQLANYGQQQEQVQQPQQVLQQPVTQSLSQPQQQPQIQQQSPSQVQQLVQLHPQIQQQQQQQQQLPPQQQQNLPPQQPLPQPQPLHQPLTQPESQPQFIPQQQAPAQQQAQPQPQVQQPLPQPITQPELQQPQESMQYPSVPQSPQPIYYQPAPALAHAPQTAYYNKEFYYLAAPQENYELPADFDDQLRKMKKNLRIVFIKAPEQTGLEKAVLQLVKDAQQPQTAIYVLTKQHSAAELAKKLQQQPNAAKQKPEVIFIKYRTRHEADQAQRTIQAQYEALNGPNHFNFESVAKTESFVNPNAVIEPRSAPAPESVAAQPVTTSSPLNYLPPAQ